MRLTLSMLESRGACQEGKDAFVQAYPNGFDGEWTPETQLGAIHSFGKFFFWAVSEKLIPLYSLYGANLRGANLSGANLRGANLSDANLYGANLTDVLIVNTYFGTKGS